MDQINLSKLMGSKIQTCEIFSRVVVIMAASLDQSLGLQSENSAGAKIKRNCRTVTNSLVVISLC